jgi:hypothetical protein
MNTHIHTYTTHNRNIIINCIIHLGNMIIVYIQTISAWDGKCSKSVRISFIYCYKCNDNTLVKVEKI